MTDSRIVVINSSTAVTATKEGDYRTTLILDTHFDTLDRVRTFAPDEQSTVPVGTPLRRALDAAFTPVTKPKFVLVGRSKGTATYAPVGVADGNEYGFTLNVDDAGTVTSQNETYTTGAAETAEDIVTALKTQFDLVTAITDVVTLTVVGTGADAVLQISLDDSSDDFSITTFTGDYTLTGTPTETGQETIDEVLTINDQFTFVVATSHTPSYQNALASVIGSYNNKLYFTSSQLSENYGTWDGTSIPAANNVMATFKYNGYGSAHCNYHHEADTKYPELLMISLFTRLEPGLQEWQFNRETVLPIAQRADLSKPLTTGDQTNIQNAGGSTTINLGGKAVFGGYEGSGGKMADGTAIQVRWWAIYAEIKIKALWETLILNSDKLGMNRFDIPKFRNLANGFLRRQASTLGRTAALDPDNPPKLVFPDPSDIVFADKVSGTLQNISITAYYDPAITNVITDLLVTYFDPDLEG